MFLALPDPHPDPLVRDTDPDPSIIKLGDLVLDTPEAALVPYNLYCVTSFFCR
jgi:hypothetical protein